MSTNAQRRHIVKATAKAERMGMTAEQRTAREHIRNPVGYGSPEPPRGKWRERSRRPKKTERERRYERAAARSG